MFYSLAFPFHFIKPALADLEFFLQAVLVFLYFLNWLLNHFSLPKYPPVILPLILIISNQFQSTHLKPKSFASQYYCSSIIIT